MPTAPARRCAWSRPTRPRRARAAALAPFATILQEPFGDIWLRDTGPIVLKAGARRLPRSFRFNGWGGKYELEGDDTIGLRLAEGAGMEAERRDWILEGGAIDVDGTGLAVTTEQCLLNPNRNPGLSRGEVEARLRDDLGIERLLWLGEGLLGDHTDGHVDNLARFVAAGTLAIPEPDGNDDPNADVYRDARRRAEAFGLKVVAPALPRPGRARRRDRPGLLHELLHRQRGCRGPPLRRCERRCGGGGGGPAFPGPPDSGHPGAPCPHRRRQLPLHQPAGAALIGHCGRNEAIQRGL